ncbi:MAG: hypothetical protein MN733_13975 [Nitrososphaera sp.]|nr:hypothetical protein [Nitrososphaera sp.]
MESALAPSAPRLIEYPADLTGCSVINFRGRNLLYLCSHETGSTPFVVVLGFFLGQKQDVITKDLLEPVADADRRQAGEAISKVIPQEYSQSHMFFL